MISPSSKHKKNFMQHRGQQEIAGFVLIVVLVVVAAMIFLIISIRKPVSQVEDARTDNLLSAMMEYTTKCAVSYEPEYSSYQDLIKNCYDDKICSNLKEDACDYLNETTRSIISDLFSSESSFSAYDLQIVHQTQEKKEDNILKVSGGSNCTGSLFGSQKIIAIDSGNLLVRLKFCY